MALFISYFWFRRINWGNCSSGSSVSELDEVGSRMGCIGLLWLTKPVMESNNTSWQKDSKSNSSVTLPYDPPDQRNFIPLVVQDGLQLVNDDIWDIWSYILESMTQNRIYFRLLHFQLENNFEIKWNLEIFSLRIFLIKNCSGWMNPKMHLRRHYIPNTWLLLLC